MSRRSTIWTDVAAALLLAVGALSAVVAPDQLQGDRQRLMYLHVPTAWVAYLTFAMTLLGSLASLRTKADRWDRFGHRPPSSVACSPV